MDKRIIIFGFSGSGKSTIANFVGKRYGLRIIHPSGILRDLYERKPIDIGNTRYNTGFWESEKGIKLFKSRLNEKEPLDVISDRILVEEIKRGHVVIDSWSLPWLTDYGNKIYLKADLETRAQRVALRSKITYEKAIAIVSMKDEETRKLLKRLYGFDIMENQDVFDCIINTNERTKDQVCRSICSYLEQSKLYKLLNRKE